MRRDPMSYEPVLFVQPDTPFAVVEQGLQALGFVRIDAVQSASPDLVHGQPELAQWAWRDPGGLLLTATFHPVTGVRELDVGLLPPQLRAAVAQAVPLADEDQLVGWLRAGTERQVLAALFAVRSAQATVALPLVDAVRDRSDGAVHTAAVEVGAALRQAMVAEGSVRNLLGARVPELVEVVTALAGAGGASVAATMAPTAGELPTLFVEEIVDDLAAFWPSGRPTPTAPPAVARGDALTFFGATGGLLRRPHELSRSFPHAYRTAAGWLQPASTWACWRAVPASDGGTHFVDGLAWTGARWVWCQDFPAVMRRVLAGRLGTLPG